MRILVCGGRDYTDFVRVSEVLDTYYAYDLVIIEGGASGADRCAKKWAYSREVGCDTYDAEWHVYGNRAGYIRNQRMLDEGKPDLVIAFPGGKGTAMMIKIAKEAGVPVIEAKDIIARY